MLRELLTGLTMGAALLAAPCVKAQTPVAADSTSTALAVFIGGVIDGTLADHSRMGFDIDRETFIRRLDDYLSGKPGLMSAAEAKEYLNGLYATMTPEAPAPLAPADAEKEAAFVAAAAERPGATQLPSGTIVETLAAGTGDVPQEDGIVEMRYRGVLSDGSVFDEVRPDEAALDFPVAALTPGLMEALTSGTIRAGGKYRVTVPASAAYGEEGIPGSIPAGAALEFTLEVISI